jgi:hypothetical protein
MMTEEVISDEANYCKDSESWIEWEKLSSSHPEDNNIQSLYALRIGLCTMVESGKIDVKRATEIFESMRESVVDSINEARLRERSGEKYKL